MISVERFRKQAEQELLTIHSRREARHLAQLLVEFVTGWPAYRVFLNGGHLLSDDAYERASSGLTLLKKGVPIQYITGNTTFMGYRFRVNAAVLIPRPETEELVQWILDDVSGVSCKLRVLDVGTGSGCIAISLAKRLPNAEVFALDVSGEALEVAWHNNKVLEANVRFVEGDILQHEALFQDAQFDIIVSNPPYVTFSERHHMSDAARLHEPDLALYAPEHDPLQFYKSIAAFAADRLARGDQPGRLYFELNAFNADEVRDELMRSGFRLPEVKRDMQGKKRMLRCSV